jgi:hypothetical protein
MGNFVSSTSYTTDTRIKKFGPLSLIHFLTSSYLECSMVNNQTGSTDLEASVDQPSNVIKNENINTCYNNYKYGNWILYIN